MVAPLPLAAWAAAGAACVAAAAAAGASASASSSAVSFFSCCAAAREPLSLQGATQVGAKAAVWTGRRAWAEGQAGQRPHTQLKPPPQAAPADQHSRQGVAPAWQHQTAARSMYCNCLTALTPGSCASAGSAQPACRTTRGGARCRRPAAAGPAGPPQAPGPRPAPAHEIMQWWQQLLMVPPGAHGAAAWPAHAQAAEPRSRLELLKGSANWRTWPAMWRQKRWMPGMNSVHLQAPTSGQSRQGKGGLPLNVTQRQTAVPGNWWAQPSAVHRQLQHHVGAQPAAQPRTSTPGSSMPNKSTSAPRERTHQRKSVDMR